MTDRSCSGRDDRSSADTSASLPWCADSTGSRSARPMRISGMATACRGGRAGGKLTSREGVATRPAMGLKEMSRRFRDMMQGAPDPTRPDLRSFDWDAPIEGSEGPRDPAAGLSVETVPLRPPPARPAASPRPRPDEARPRAEEPRSPHWRAKADVADFRSVYAEAGITTPAHGYGVEKIAAMLANPHLASRPRDVRATAALAALEAAPVPLRDVIDDAVLRHKALAAFEAAKAPELQATRNRSRSRIEALQEQVR